jgi:hypothetical protein
MHAVTESRVIQELARACREAGSQKAFAVRHALSTSYVTDVLLGRRRPGQKILAVLGYTREVRYMRAGDGD